MFELRVCVVCDFDTWRFFCCGFRFDLGFVGLMVVLCLDLLGFSLLVVGL